MATPDGGKPSALQRMYETGEWSDMTIETSSKTFQVHKAVICGNDFFNAACTQGFLETGTNNIKLPESARVVDCMLRDLYEYEYPEAECLLEAPDGKADSENMIRYIIEHADVMLAADKYHLPRLAAAAQQTFSALLDLSADVLLYHLIVAIGKAIFDMEGDCLDKMRDIIVTATIRVMTMILANQEVYDILFENTTYAQRTMKKYISRLQIVLESGDDE